MGYMLTLEALQATKDKIAKINAKASKKGLSGRLEVIAEETTVTHDVGGIPVEEILYSTTITGEPPKHNGWVFLATLEFVETGVIVRAVPGAPTANRDKFEPNKCDHCGTYRRRNETYVVLNEHTGEQLQVGSTCLKDFLGWSGTVAFLTDDDVEREVIGYVGSGSPVYTTESILAVAWACVTTFGYAKAHEDNPTKATVYTVIAARENRYNRELKARIAPVAKDAVPMAQKLREFILSDEFGPANNDYVQNLKTYCAANTNTARSFGFLASVPQAYARHLEKTLIRERANANRKNEWIGTLRKRQTFKVKVRAVKWLEDFYSPYGGSKPLYTLITEDGYTLKWFASNDSVLGKDVTPEDQDFFDLVGTVVNHEEYEGYKSTCINRCKLG